jgi:hypothetical protein
MGEHRYTLNGETAPVHEIRSQLHNLSQAEVRSLTGGALFQYLYTQDTHHFGILPWYTEGQRNSHHEIPMAVDSSLKLIGNLDQKGRITILFRAKNLPISPELLELYREQYRKFAHFFTDTLTFGSFPLDDMTNQMLSDAGLGGMINNFVRDLKKL